MRRGGGAVAARAARHVLYLGVAASVFVLLGPLQQQLLVAVAPSAQHTATRGPDDDGGDDNDCRLVCTLGGDGEHGLDFERVTLVAFPRGTQLLLRSPRRSGASARASHSIERGALPLFASCTLDEAAVLELPRGVRRLVESTHGALPLRASSVDLLAVRSALLRMKLAAAHAISGAVSVSGSSARWHAWMARSAGCMRGGAHRGGSGPRPTSSRCLSSASALLSFAGTKAPAH